MTVKDIVWSAGVRRLAAIGVAAMAGLVGLVQPVSAATTLTGGTGAETMAGVPFSVPPLGTPCAHYTAYNATVTFGTTVAVINSGTAVWDENGSGTYTGNPTAPPVGTNGCDGPLAPISGFSYSIAGNVACTAVPATYQRTDLNIVVKAAGATLCPITELDYTIATANIPGDPVGVASGLLGTVIGIVSTLPPPVGPILGGVLGGLVGGPVQAVGNPVSLCNSPIAPSACVIGPQVL